jgi:hypothetical protein
LYAFIQFSKWVNHRSQKRTIHDPLSRNIVTAACRIADAIAMIYPVDRFLY